MSKFWYVELEPLNARYTEQLCRQWVPQAFDRATRLDVGHWEFVPVPAAKRVGREISVGHVLDAVGRGVVSLEQVVHLLSSDVRDGDVVFFQDFWTPGIEALLYAWHQTGRRPRLYARNFAQSVDAYDFTYGMRGWMRPIELAWASAMSGMFVASEAHREQLRAAGYACPIHVTGLPFFRPAGVTPGLGHKKLQVAFTSRLNAEKNPWFMLDVAAAFLARHPDWTWAVTTSAARFACELPGVLGAMQSLADTGRLVMSDGLTKAEYMATLDQSAIQFNSSLQDYVAFTMLEAAASNCDLVYPNFRSFPECVDPSRLYRPFDIASALDVLDEAVASPRTWPRAPVVCEQGLEYEIAMMLTGYSGPEVSVWHQPRSFFRASGLAS